MTDRDAIALTIYGEARGEGIEGMIAVSRVILNRYHAGGYGRSLAEVCQKPKAFSCWNTDDDNRPRLLELMGKRPPIDNLALNQCYVLADVLLFEVGAAYNFVNVCHYFAGSDRPKWFRDGLISFKLGRHTFVRDVDKAGAPIARV